MQIAPATRRLYPVLAVLLPVVVVYLASQTFDSGDHIDYRVVHGVAAACVTGIWLSVVITLVRGRR